MRLDGAKRVLVAESDTGVGRSLEMLFARSGCECKLVTSGEEAIALAAAWEPDTVVMEFILTGMLGLDAAYILRDKCPGCVILMIYGQVVSELVEQAEDDGFLAFKKPVDPGILLQAAGVSQKGGSAV